LEGIWTRVVEPEQPFRAPEYLGIAGLFPINKNRGKPPKKAKK
jgi:hypothetical protein